MIERTMDAALQPTGDPAWLLEEVGFDALRESSRESRFSISNGFLGVRGGRALNRAIQTSVPPRTYVAGLFDTPGTEQPIPGLVSAADWLLVSLSTPDGPLVHGLDRKLSDRRTIDFRRGVVLDECRQQDAAGLSVRVRALRLVSAGDRAIGLQLVEVAFETGRFAITLQASCGGIDVGLVLEHANRDLAVWHTRTSGKRLAMATAVSLHVGGDELSPSKVGDLSWSWTWQSQPGQRVCFARRVAVERSDGADPGPMARNRIAAGRQSGWRGVIAAHELAWADRWRNSDVEIDGDPEAQKALRFALYHLNGAADPTNDRVSIGARALTGEAYRGHVFWDTEIFLLPFYTLTWPQAARALLTYRFHTLDAARQKAAGLGWRGAMYAWESADTGAETTPEEAIGPDRRVVKILCGRQEQHISADIAYAVWQYWLATADEEFLLDAGAEIILETGRFWSSRTGLEEDGLNHIRGVIGPDEYHEQIDDNAYTNVMARWNIRRALEVAALLGSRWPDTWQALSSRLGLNANELEDWAAVADSMATGLVVETGIYEQFAGFFDLERIDLANYAGRSVPMDVVLGRERTGKSQIIKQADVVALLALLPTEFAGQSGAANFRFYEPLCSQASSLSPPMHGLVAARLGQTDMARRYLERTASIDLADTHVAIDGGLHIAALGGIWLMAVFGFAGLSLLDDGLAFEPKLPENWRSLTFPVQWRRRHLRIRIGQTARVIEATLEQGEPMTIHVTGVPHRLSRNQAVRTGF